MTTGLGPAVGQVYIDPGHLEQVLVNLCVNARDAMPTGGKLTIGARDVELGEDYARGRVGATMTGQGVEVGLAANRETIDLNYRITGDAVWQL